jgi:hypothetical protein
MRKGLDTRHQTISYYSPGPTMGAQERPTDDFRFHISPFSFFRDSFFIAYLVDGRHARKRQQKAATNSKVYMCAFDTHTHLWRWNPAGGKYKKEINIERRMDGVAYIRLSILFSMRSWLFKVVVFLLPNKRRRQTLLTFDTRRHRRENECG